MVKAWRIAASKMRPKIKKKYIFLLRFAALVFGHGLFFGHSIILVKKGLVAFYKLV